MRSEQIDIKSLREHWQNEGESVLLYRALAEIEPDERHRRLYLRLADVEAEHQEAFARLLAEHGVQVGGFRPSLRARFLVWLVRHGGSSTVLTLRIADEAHEVKSHLRERQTRMPSGASELSERVALDEARHMGLLIELTGRRGEPWHRIESGGFLRNVVYGFNDGLTANFGLVMGVLGAETPVSFVLLAGLAGLVADALSMGSSGYLAAKSEQEVYQHEIALEREEIRLMPEVEAEELALLYEAKGMPASAARQAAAQVMADPKIALQEKAREELGVVRNVGSPLREGLLTGAATALGALIPVLPFFFGRGPEAIWASVSISMLSHFVVGAARSLFTGRGVFRSGLDMFLVGLGIAAVGYLVGALITGHLW